MQLRSKGDALDVIGSIGWRLIISRLSIVVVTQASSDEMSKCQAFAQKKKKEEKHQ